jgi:hypothetical protein
VPGESVRGRRDELALHDPYYFGSGRQIVPRGSRKLSLAKGYPLPPEAQWITLHFLYATRKSAAAS